MSRFQELSDYKFTIIRRLLEREEICKGIYYSDSNFLDKNSLEDPAESLIYKHIYPFRFIPDINDTKKTFITMTFHNFQLVNNKFSTGLIYLSVFTHRDLFKTDYGCTRVDFLLDKIDELFTQKRGLGMGQLEFVKMDEIFINDKYHGSSLCYKPVDIVR